MNPLEHIFPHNIFYHEFPMMTFLCNLQKIVYLHEHKHETHQTIYNMCVYQWLSAMLCHKQIHLFQPNHVQIYSHFVLANCPRTHTCWLSHSHDDDAVDMEMACSVWGNTNARKFNSRSSKWPWLLAAQRRGYWVQNGWAGPSEPQAAQTSISFRLYPWFRGGGGGWDSTIPRKK